MLLPHAIDHSDDVEHLLSYGCIGLVRKLIQLSSESLGRRPVGSVLEVRQPIEIDWPTHLHATAKAMVACQFLAGRLYKLSADRSPVARTGGWRDGIMGR
jgi:hypothetical protein